MNPELLQTASLRAAPWGAPVTRILAAALAAAEPAAAVGRYLRREGDVLHAGDRTYDLGRYDRVFVVGTGKAGAPMARAAAEVLGDRLAGGVMVVKEGYTEEIRRQEDTETGGIASPSLVSLSPGLHVSLVEAGHPIPDERGVAGARHMADLLARATERDLVIALISGGGSALLTLPASGVSLADMQALTAALLACGASINEINTLRKHLDQVKGGGLVRMAHPATLVTLILSDVVGNPLDVIASGPTVSDPTTFADAYAILERYELLGAAAPPILEHLRRGIAGAVEETPKPGDVRFDDLNNLLIGSNAQAAEAAQAAAQAEGLRALVLTSALEGEARLVGCTLGEIAARLAAVSRPLAAPLCLIWGGETTVTLHGNGIGGRNQELALAAVQPLADVPDVALITLATDGGDGPTDAAGAVVTGATLDRATRLSLDPAAYLARNDSYGFFAALDDLLRPGPTQTNVNDLAFLFAF